MGQYANQKKLLLEARIVYAKLKSPGYAIIAKTWGNLYISMGLHDKAFIGKGTFEIRNTVFLVRNMHWHCVPGQYRPHFYWALKIWFLRNNLLDVNAVVWNKLGKDSLAMQPFVMVWPWHIAFPVSIKKQSSLPWMPCLSGKRNLEKNIPL